jgi:mRNA interferase MazF
MPTFSQGDVVRVPFPYTDRNTRQHRPALVISNGAIGDGGTLLWVAMITSAANRPWPGDCPIPDYAAAGLPIPSIVRPAKITTIEARDAETIGHVPDAVLVQALDTVITLLGRQVGA